MGVRRHFSDNARLFHVPGIIMIGLWFGCQNLLRKRCIEAKTEVVIETAWELKFTVASLPERGSTATPLASVLSKVQVANYCDDVPLIEVSKRRSESSVVSTCQSAWKLVKLVFERGENAQHLLVPGMSVVPIISLRP